LTVRANAKNPFRNPRVLAGEGDEELTGSQLALWANLTRSEQRVAWLASQGHRTAEIAQRLSKSPLTVKKQLQSVYQKLAVSGRHRLIALFRSVAPPQVQREPPTGHAANRPGARTAGMSVPPERMATDRLLPVAPA
jgi:DNA-binding CsgD family transcriptional regulator